MKHSGFRSLLVSIQRKFIVAISTAHNREKGVNAIVVEALSVRRERDETPLEMQQVRKMLSSSSSSSSHYSFVSLELGQR